MAASDYVPNLSKYRLHPKGRPQMESSDHLREVLAHCSDTPGVHLIDCPVDYSENDQILNHDIKELSKKL